MKKDIYLFLYSVFLSSLFSCIETDNINKKNWNESDNPIYEITDLFNFGRFPNIISNKNGKIILTWGKDSIFVRVSVDNGKIWSERKFISNGINGGGLTFDNFNNKTLFFIEDKHPPSSKIYKIESNDFFQTFEKKDYTDLISPNSIHMNDHGIVLNYNSLNKGRIVIPSRNYSNSNSSGNWPNHYSNAIISDDGGKTWKISEKFPVNGTGEGTIIELKNGNLIYNSRRHFSSIDKMETRFRNIATSYNGGVTWEDHYIDYFLPDGDKCRNYGLMGSLISIPTLENEILLFSNIDSDCGRKNGTIWFKSSNEENWNSKLIYEGPFGYSSITYNINSITNEEEILIFFESDGEGKLIKTNLAFLKQ